MVNKFLSLVRLFKYCVFTVIILVAKWSVSFALLSLLKPYFVFFFLAFFLHGRMHFFFLPFTFFSFLYPSFEFLEDNLISITYW